MSAHRALPLILALVAAAPACFPKGWPPPEAPLYLERTSPFDVGPYLVMLAPGRMAVVLEHDLPEPPRISWRTATTPLGERTALEIDGLWVATLEGLPLDEPLSYQVSSAAGNVGPVAFRAGRSRGQRFSFAAFGDTRTGHDVHRALVAAMAQEPVELVVHSGDLVETGGVAAQWALFLQIEEPLMAGRPLLAAVGNHDNSQRLHYRRYFLADAVAEGNRYFYQDWGDLRVIIMDSEVEARRGSEQYAFLEAALRDGAAKDMIMVLSLHYPPYSSGAHGSTLELREVLGELAPRYGVELVLAGHDHNYERTKRIDGVTYMVAASGGAPIRRVRPSWFSAAVRTEPHFVIFDVDKKSLVGRAVNLDGETFDSFVIPPNPPRPDFELESVVPPAPARRVAASGGVR
ncbi:MAG: metallophosphoesterase [Myxococcales bacterium]|nr:metallophosphoesterase [Myxococcales bacterium]